MAKKQDVTVTRFNMVGDGVELAARIVFGLSLFKGDESIEHVANIDFSMTKAQLVSLVIKSIVIAIQKIGRDVCESHAKMRIFTGNTLSYLDVFPGTRRAAVSVARDMTPSEIRERAKNDAKFRADLMAELMAMEDDEIENAPKMPSAVQNVDIKAA